MSGLTHGPAKFSAVAAAAIAGPKRFVVGSTAASGSRRVTKPTDATTAALVGVTDNGNTAIAAADDVLVINFCRAKLEVDGSGTAIAAFDALTTDAAGLGVKATTGDYVGAYALEAASGDGQIIDVMVCCIPFTFQ